MEFLLIYVEESSPVEVVTTGMGLGMAIWFVLFVNWSLLSGLQSKHYMSDRPKSEEIQRL